MQGNKDSKLKGTWKKRGLEWKNDLESLSGYRDGESKSMIVLMIKGGSRTEET